MTMKKEEPICMEYIVDPGSSIKQFRQAMGGAVIGLVKVLQFMEK